MGIGWVRSRYGDSQAPHFTIRDDDGRNSTTGTNTIQANRKWKGFDMARVRYGSVVLLSALSFMATPCFARKVNAILGVHVKDCAAFNTSSKSFQERSLQANYILGFLTASASYSEGDLFAGDDTTHILDWFDKYCAAHPEDEIYRALKRYVDTEGGRK
jgi:hypothetical protein